MRLQVEAEILRCMENINLSVKNWGEIKVAQSSIDDTVIVPALAAHVLNMAEQDSIPIPEFLAMYLAVAIKMIYEERNARTQLPSVR